MSGLKKLKDYKLSPAGKTAYYMSIAVSVQNWKFKVRRNVGAFRPPSAEGLNRQHNKR
jgi:hypothetical protein